MLDHIHDDQMTDHLTVDGNRLEVKHWPGDAAKPTIVYLHHGLGCVGTWKDFPDQLCAATGCPGFAYSRLGYGASDPSDPPLDPNWITDEALHVLPELLRQADIGERILLGHSDGGAIAYAHAGGCPDGVRGVITEAGHTTWKPGLREAMTDTIELFRTTDLREKLMRYHGDNVDCAFGSWAESWMQPGQDQWNILEYLPKIACPVLAIGGVQDVYGNRNSLAKVEELVTAPLTVVEPDCGHDPHHELRAEMLAVMAGFVEGLL